MSALGQEAVQSLEGGDWFDVDAADVWEHARPDPPRGYVDRLFRTRHGHWTRAWRGFVDTDGRRIVRLAEVAWWECTRAAARTWLAGNGYDPQLAGVRETTVDANAIVDTFAVIGREEAWRLHLLVDGSWLQEEFAADGAHVYPVRSRVVARAAAAFGARAPRLDEATAGVPVDPEEV